MGDRPVHRPPVPASHRHRDRVWQRRAFALGMIASVLLHGALFLVRTPAEVWPTPELSERRIVVLPPHEKAASPPPAVEVALPRAVVPVPRPADPVPTEAPSENDQAPAEPMWIPHEVPPRLVNAAEVRTLLADPRFEGAAGTDRVAVLWLYVDRSGAVRKLQLRHSSGSTRLDSLVQRVGRAMEFSPALNHGRSVGVWISQPVRFSFTVAAPLAGRSGSGGR